MHIEPENKRFADFSRQPYAMSNPVVVSRLLPDGSKVLIGWICQHVTLPEGEFPTFLSLNNDGDELFPATEDYSEAESRFERYAKRLTLESQHKEQTTNTLRHDDRIEAMKELRVQKGRNERSKTINK